MNITITDDAVGVFQQAYLDELRCWRINEVFVGMSRFAATRWPTVSVQVAMTATDAINETIRREVFDDKATASFFVQRMSIAKALETLMNHPDLGHLLPITEAAET